MINLLTRGLLGAARQSLYRWRQYGADISGGTNDFGFGENAAITPDGTTVAVYKSLYQYQFSPARYTGTVTVFRWNGQRYAQIGQEITRNEQNNSFGKGLQLSSTGNRIAILKTGEGFIYDFNGTQWTQNVQVTSAQSMAISGDGLRFVKGHSEGGAFVYDYNGTTWIGSQLSGENLGWQISQNGTRVANNVGRIFELQSGTWVQIVNLNLGAPSQFAGNAWLNADGTMFAQSTGAQVKVFKEAPAGTWTQLGGTFTGGGPSNVMSCAMSANGRLIIRDLVIGAPVNTWTVKAYEYLNSAWQQIAPTRIFYNSLNQSSAQISGDGKTFGFGSTQGSRNGDPSSYSYSMHRKELD